MPSKIKRILFILGVIFLLVFAFSLSLLLMAILVVFGGGYYVFMHYIRPLFSKGGPKDDADLRVFDADYEIVDEDDTRPPKP